MPATFISASPISGNINALPVSDIGPAIGYYIHVLGFSLISKEEGRATLARDTATIGLEINEDDPGDVSCYFGVKDVDALREEYVQKGIEPSAIRTDTYDGKQFRVFFAKEPYGVCFCFGEPA